MWQKILLLGVGGFIGSNLRYWITGLVTNLCGSTIPYGTLAVNMLGSFILGFLMFYGTEVIELSPQLRLMISTGMLGALTTFSTFSLETFNLLRESSYILMFLNIFLNIGLSFLAVLLGFTLSKAI